MSWPPRESLAAAAILVLVMRTAPAQQVPALDLVIGFTGGSYNDPSLFKEARPEFILPTVNE